MEKYPRDARAFIGMIKAWATDRLVWLPFGLGWGKPESRDNSKKGLERLLAYLEETKKNPPVGITNPDDVKKIRELGDEYISKTRAALQRYVPSSYLWMKLMGWGFVLTLISAVISLELAFLVFMLSFGLGILFCFFEI